MSERIEITRRSFLAGLGAGLVVGVGFAHGAPAGTRPGGSTSTGEASGRGFAPNVFVHIAADGTTTIVCHRSEMGQGVRSTIPALIAAELGADPARVVVRQAEGDRKYGDQNTDGSGSIRRQYELLRTSGAVARMMLVTAAAKRWRVKPSALVVANHEVIDRKRKRALPFAELVAAAAKLPVPEPSKVVLRPLAELPHVSGANLPLLDGHAIVTGTAVFGADVKLPDMLVAVIARPPVVGGTLAKYDGKRALAIPGVKHVIEMPPPAPPWQFQPWGGVAVLAENTWAAMRGRAALDLAWEHGPNASYSSAAFKDTLLASVRAPGTALRTVGDVDAAFAAAARTVEAEYLVPHLAHLPMEPLVAIARVDGDTAEVWAPTQHPQSARTQVARVLGLPEDKVTIHVTLLGGGFGRKSKPDFIVEAALLAKRAGVPVRVQWTRDDDVRHGYYNAVSAQRLRAALDARNTITAWHHRTAFTPIASTFDDTVDTPSLGELQQGVLDLALAVPNVRAEACKARAHARIGWYRSVYNIFHAFAIGSFVDELAHARGADPRDTWLELIGPARTLSLAELGVEKLSNYGEPLAKHPVDAGRLRRVIERVTDAARWSTREADGRYLGLAAHRSFVSYTAVVLSVVPDPQRTLRIDEAWIAMDAGTVVNQERFHAQLEGSVVMGISNALYGGITMTDGAVDQTNFRDARIARMRDVPRTIHTDLVPSTAPPSGVGEPGVPPVGAALANAIFALTGKRLREIPLARGLRT